MPDSSIIIVTYNGLREHTIPCLESIFAHSGEAYEVIVVDNHSNDGTPAYLQELAAREPRLKLVLNSRNRGFAGGNNDGMKIAAGNVIVLLNNDTRVTPGWLNVLSAALRDGPDIGMVGPVSNAVGNEQKIYTAGMTPEAILEEGMDWTAHAKDGRFETERLGFFCVAFRRELLGRVGLLDEAYDLGFYEDDDYCLRVRRAGLRLVCCQDVFVYHRGSASFDKIPRTVAQLLKKNRRLLETKFGICYAPVHQRERLLALVADELTTSAADLDSAGLLFRLQNRMELVRELLPRGFFKRWMFLRRMRRITEPLARLTQHGELP